MNNNKQTEKNSTDTTQSGIKQRSAKKGTEEKRNETNSTGILYKKKSFQTGADYRGGPITAAEGGLQK